MKGRRVKFTIEYEVNLDALLGWGHQIEDWQKLAMSDILRQEHYHTTAKVVQNKEAL